MGNKKTLKWIGSGVISINKKSYGFGDEIPVDALDPKRLDSLIKAGKIGDPPTPVEAMAEKEVLKTMVSELKGTIDDLEDKIERQEKTISGLESKNIKLAAEVELMQKKPAKKSAAKSGKKAEKKTEAPKKEG